uniref:C3H1-type domain-containing protein n=1 Tax=Anguilla anguilla TaxID=7936 RepID=A0A0E9PEE7_ANGAN
MPQQPSKNLIYYFLFLFLFGLGWVSGSSCCQYEEFKCQSRTLCRYVHFV